MFGLNVNTITVKVFFTAMARMHGCVVTQLGEQQQQQQQQQHKLYFRSNFGVASTAETI